MKILKNWKKIGKKNCESKRSARKLYLRVVKKFNKNLAKEKNWQKHAAIKGIGERYHWNREIPKTRRISEKRSHFWIFLDFGASSISLLFQILNIG